jgi:hypothetical protein
MNQRIPLTRFVFHTHKPKAQALAEAFAKGCASRGYDCVVTSSPTPLPDRIALFYGVVPETYAAYRFYLLEGRAIYLDNGWLSTPERPTFRFCWNGVQPFLRDLEPVRRYEYFPSLPYLLRIPQRDLALLILQSRDYFTNLRLGYSRDVWERATTRLLTAKGYRVETREKPTKKDPEAETFFDQMARAGIVVSLNSAATVKALRYGIPAYCTLDCTLSPYAPVKLPDVGKAAPPTRADVHDMMKRLARYELTKADLAKGDAIDRFLAVKAEHRRGYTYGT